MSKAKLRRIYIFFSKTKFGNALIILLPIVLFLFIFGLSLIRRTTSEHTQSFHVHRQNVVMYLAEGCLNIAMQYVSENLETKFKKMLIEDSLGVYNLYEKVPEIKNAVKFLLEAMPNAELVRLTMDFQDAIKFDKLQVDPYEKMGILVFTCTIKYFDTSTTLKITRDIKIVNVNPVAADFTLYINSPSENEHIINSGPSIFCKNKDESNGALGSIRICGGDKGNIFYLGEKYGWNDLSISPMPTPTRNEVYKKYGLFKISQVYDALSNLPKPLISLFQSSLEVALSEFAVNPHDAQKKYNCIISIGKPIPDIPKEVYGGIVYKDEKDKVKQAYGKGGLFGYPTISNITFKKLYLPKALYGKGLKKLYGKYTLSEKVITIPLATNPPQNVDVYVYYYGPKEAERIIEPYSSADGSFSVIDSDIEGRIGLDGIAALKPLEYKKRALYSTSEINLNKLQQLFSVDGNIIINGIIFGKKVDIGLERQPFIYNGRCIIAADQEMTIHDNVLINDKLESKILSSLSLIFYPKTALSNIGITPLKYKARKINVDGEKALVLKIDANIFSYDGLQFEKSSVSGSITSGLTRLYIFGNLAVNRFLNKDFSPWLFISYKKRLNEKNYNQYVVSMSPIYSSWYEEKQKGK